MRQDVTDRASANGYKGGDDPEWANFGTLGRRVTFADTRRAGRAGDGALARCDAAADLGRSQCRRR